MSVREGSSSVQLEIAPGERPGDYFVATFSGARVVGLVRLHSDYDAVLDIDLIQMVAAERDISGFPRIAVTGPESGRRLEVVGRGASARLELHPFQHRTGGAGAR